MALVSPWNYTTTDASGLVLSVQLTFDNVLFTILTATSHKDAGCAYSIFYFGLGADGTPDSSASKVTIAAGDAVIGVLLLNGFGFTSIQQALSVQATAGP